MDELQVLAFHFANGDAFFLGAALLVVGALVGFLAKTRTLAAVERILLATGVALVFFSATPLEWALYAAWGIAVLLALCRKLPEAGSDRKHLSLAGLLLIAATVAVVWAEAPYHVTPHVPAEGFSRIVVIGDSITAHAHELERTWPDIYAQTSMVEVVDLSEPGLSLETALGKLDEVGDVIFAGALVILEVGGNDMLSLGTLPAEFEQNLDRILARATGNGAVVILMELPLPPLCNRYGLAQRRAAARHSAVLLPKRRFAEVLAGAETAIDGLHLSKEGHQAMADLFAEVLAPAPAAEGQAEENQVGL